MIKFRIWLYRVEHVARQGCGTGEIVAGDAGTRAAKAGRRQGTRHRTGEEGDRKDRDRVCERGHSAEGGLGYWEGQGPKDNLGWAARRGWLGAA